MRTSLLKICCYQYCNFSVDYWCIFVATSIVILVYFFAFLVQFLYTKLMRLVLTHASWCGVIANTSVFGCCA